MSSVRVYETTFCPYCVAAKRYLKRMNIDYETIDVSSDMEKRQWLLRTTGMRTVPQIFVGETSVGGYTDMVDLDRRGEFRPLLEREGVTWTE